MSLTQELADYAAGTQFDALPEAVREEGPRALLNWLGCALGGCGEDPTTLATSLVVDQGGRSQASIIGTRVRTDVASAAFVNCISSSVLAFDDAHLPTVTHPSGPVASALLALAETVPIDGRRFVNALTLGIEVQCRLSTALVLPPSKFNVGFYVSGLTAPIGVALAVGKLLDLDAQRLNWAIGIAASQASGFRATHGTMTAHFRPGHATRAGVVAALLAKKGFSSDEHALEADKGFFDVYSSGADLGRIVEDLGDRFESLQNAYKPYPCGIVIHPALDACLDIRSQCGLEERPVEVSLQVHPLALSLTGVRDPRTPLESAVSLYHWVAAALIRGRAGIAEMQQDCVDDPAIRHLRSTIHAVADPTVGREQAVVQVTFNDGRVLRSDVTAVRGSSTKPMSDAELDQKFLSQAETFIDAPASRGLMAACRNVLDSRNVARDIFLILQTQQLRSTQHG
jgi:2-methylcitrate dehydratase PrpD